VSYFNFVVPGQPMSWNRSYRNRVITVKDKIGRTVLTPKGRPVTRPVSYKTKDAERYQEDVFWAAKEAILRLEKDIGTFKPEQVMVAYDFMLARDIDCDNVMKMIHDALSRALGLDDRYFYPVVLSKSTGSKDPSVSVSVYDRAVWKVDISQR
jgi:Holliday junction resolvase RusA-like endonuclease